MNNDQLKVAIEKVRALTLDYAIAVFDAKGGKMVNAAWVVEQLRGLKEVPLGYSVIAALTAAQSAVQSAGNDERAFYKAWDDFHASPKKDDSFAAFETAWQAGRASLAKEQEQKPVATVKSWNPSHTYGLEISTPLPVGTKLYAAPQAQQEVGKERIAQLEAALRSVDAVAIERGDKFGVCDQIDNSGKPYKSQWLHDLLASTAQADTQQSKEK